MISTNPEFTTGPGVYLLYYPDYYLSQVDAGQAMDSPCLDTGDPNSSMFEGTTRTDQVQDLAPMDMGYHYPLPSFQLTVDPMPLVSGAWATFTVLKGQSYTTTALVYSLSGYSQDVFYFPQWNLYLDLINPTQAGGFETANSEGTAEWVLLIPSVPPGGVDVWFQAAQPAPGSEEGWATNVVATRIE